MSETRPSGGGQRILLIGSPGSGKSVLAEQLSHRLGLPLVRMDDLYWREGWTRSPEGTFLAELEEAVRRERWIIDGHHQPSLGVRLDRADTIVLLDLPPAVCLFRVLVRGLRRQLGATRDLPRRVRDEPRGRRGSLDLAFVRKVLSFRRVVRPGLLRTLEPLRTSKRILILRKRGSTHQLTETVLAALRDGLTA
ncbi:MAG: AAA family ATPase [Cystobacter sp.]